MDLVSVYAKAPYGCLITPGASFYVGNPFPPGTGCSSRDKFLVAVPVHTVPLALSAQMQMWLLCDCDKGTQPA